MIIDTRNQKKRETDSIYIVMLKSSNTRLQFPLLVEEVPDLLTGSISP